MTAVSHYHTQEDNLFPSLFCSRVEHCPFTGYACVHVNQHFIFSNPVQHLHAQLWGRGATGASAAVNLQTSLGTAPLAGMLSFSTNACPTNLSNVAVGRDAGGETLVNSSTTRGIPQCITRDTRSPYSAGKEKKQWENEWETRETFGQTRTCCFAVRGHQATLFIDNLTEVL